MINNDSDYNMMMNLRQIKIKAPNILAFLEKCKELTYI